jgi:PadR family transcriptional regulator PadR
VANLLATDHLLVPAEGSVWLSDSGVSGNAKLEDRVMERDFRKGSTKVLILNMLAEKPTYGYQIAKELKRRSGGYFAFKEGTLYPALHQMEKDGLLRSEWQVVEKGPSRKYYHLTEAGRKVLADSTREWTTFSRRLLSILGEQGTEAASG